MMTVLVVDDQERILKVTKLLVHWDRIGVDRVYTASGSEPAKKIMEKEKIDILLTDIEMPGEDGLALHRWQLAHSPETACIFLTSHADFSYAQQAIRNGAYGYILQPAEIPEIENTVSKCVRHLQEQRSMKLKSEEFDEKRSQISEDFVFALFYQRSQFTQMDDFRRSTGTEDAGRCFLPVLAESFKTDSAGLRAVLEPALRLPGQAQLIYSRLDDDHAGIILVMTDEENSPATGGPNLSAEAIRQKFQEILDKVSGQLGRELNLYVGKLSGDDLPEKIEKIYSFTEGRILAHNRVFLPEEIREAILRKPDSNEWGQWLIRGDGVLIRNQIANLLRNAEEDYGLTEEYMRELIHLFLEACSAACYDQKREVQSLFTDEFSYEDMLHAYNSPDRLLEGVDMVLRQYSQGSGDEGRDATASERVREVMMYVGTHMDQPVTRRDAAKYVYMNEDYFSRIFRRETGMGFKEYVTEVKMNYAKRLLEETDMPVVIISSKVGYDDFNNFSKSFRKLVGVSPTEYRKKHRS
ncbi:MAG: response regulator transcription factor [Lachnospiraceae bacterium]|jgi:two-component system response regulator YesN